jgi:superfamily II DNA or RNA helicase
MPKPIPLHPYQRDAMRATLERGPFVLPVGLGKSIACGEVSKPNPFTHYKVRRPERKS